LPVERYGNLYEKSGRNPGGLFTVRCWIFGCLSPALIYAHSALSPRDTELILM
jgi:hypothetical protein